MRRERQERLPAVERSEATVYRVEGRRGRWLSRGPAVLRAAGRVTHDGQRLTPDRPVVEHVATVYRFPMPGCPRRLTERAAYLDAARWAIWSVDRDWCGCEPAEPEVGLGPAPCDLHDTDEGGRYYRIRDRLARWLRWRDRRAQTHESPDQP
jgi:hypothetical protein